MAGIGVGILLMGLAPVSLFALAVFGMLLGGVMSSSSDSPLTAIFQGGAACEAYRDRSRLLGSGSAAMMPLGLAIAGPMAEVIGVRAWFLIGGAITLLIAFVCMFVPAVRNIERERDDHPNPEEAPAGQQAATRI